VSLKFWVLGSYAGAVNTLKFHKKNNLQYPLIWQDSILLGIFNQSHRIFFSPANAAIGKNSRSILKPVLYSAGTRPNRKK
jgi:hypothetical protein